MKPFKMIRWGIKTKDGIILVGHDNIPIMNDTKGESRKSATHKGDKVIRIVIEER